MPPIFYRMMHYIIITTVSDCIHLHFFFIIYTTMQPQVWNNTVLSVSVNTVKVIRTRSLVARVVESTMCISTRTRTDCFFSQMPGPQVYLNGGRYICAVSE